MPKCIVAVSDIKHDRNIQTQLHALTPRLILLINSSCFLISSLFLSSYSLTLHYGENAIRSIWKYRLEGR